MMLADDQLDQIYKVNIDRSHYAALRGVWDDGYQTALGTQAGDSSQAIASTSLDTTQTTVVITQP